MFGDARSYPRLHEEHVSRKGIILLVPWMLLGTLWLKLSTGLSQADVDFYFALLVAGAVSLVLVAQNDRRVSDELARLKLLPFVLFFGVTLAGVFMAITAGTLLLAGTLNFNSFQPTQFATFLAMTCLIVAPVETLVFQFVVPKITTMSLKTADAGTRKGAFQFAMLGGVVSQLTFAGFHYAAYSHELMSMGFAFLLGLGFYALVRSSPVWGLGAAIGAHAGWNIAVTLLTNDGNMNAILGGIL